MQVARRVPVGMRSSAFAAAWVRTAAVTAHAKILISFSGGG
jgi:hypothetical protein